MRQRTEDEVVEHTRAVGDDWLGFRAEVLVSHLSADKAREFCKEDADLSEWEALPLHVESVFAEMVDYLDFAWGKALDHRGISANRSIDKLSELLWLIGDDEVLALFEAADYMPYGAPQLAVISSAYKRPIPDDEMARRMASGLPCHPGCTECVS